MFTPPLRDRSHPLSPARTVSADPHTPLPKRRRHYPHPRSSSVFLPSSPSSSSSDHASPSPSPPPPPEPTSPQPPNSASTHRNLAQLRRDRLRHNQARRPVIHTPSHHPFQRNRSNAAQTRSNPSPLNKRLQPVSTRVAKNSHPRSQAPPVWSHISAAAVRELARPVLAVRTEQRDIELAWFGRKVYGGAKGGCGVGVEMESVGRKGEGTPVARLARRVDAEWDKVEARGGRHGKQAAASAKRMEHASATTARRVEIAKKVSTDGGREDASVKRKDGRFFVKATCRYGWENSTRCVFVEHGCSFRMLKEQLAEAFNMEKRFDVSYKDEDGDSVRISTEAEMQPFLNLVRKQGDKVRVRMVAPDGPGGGKDLGMTG